MEEVTKGQPTNCKSSPVRRNEPISIGCAAVGSATMRDWSELPVDLLISIFDLLSVIDQCRVQAVCSPWNVAAKYCSEIFSNTIKDSLGDQTPWLMLPLTTKPKYGIDPDDTSCTIFNLKEKKMYKLNCLMEELGDSYCVGSSHGWLVLLDQNAHVFLFNPFTNSRIQLPSVDFLCDVCDSVRQHIVCTRGDTMAPSWVRNFLFVRAILCFDDDRDEIYAVAVIHSECKVAYCKRGDDRWIDLNSTGGLTPGKFDIVYKDNKLYIVSLEDLVEVWDIHGHVPIRTDAVSDWDEVEDWEPESLGDFYVVKSEDDLLTVLRMMEVIETGEGYVHFKTTNFLVYKLDFEARLWRRVRSLKERALFVCQSQSLSLVAGQVNGIKQNSIYFTDECWGPNSERPPSNYHYGNYVSVFNMDDGTIQHIYRSELSRELPQHVWIVPNLSNLKGRSNSITSGLIKGLIVSLLINTLIILYFNFF